MQRELNFETTYLRVDVQSEASSVLESTPHVPTQISCGLHCLDKPGCVTAIYRLTHNNECILMKTNLKSIAEYGPTDSQVADTKTIVLRAMDPCSLNPCFRGRHCLTVDFGLICQCAHDERGHLCEIKLTGLSCLDIKNKYSNLNPKNGHYLISSLKSNNDSFIAYCDMEFDEGGWTQVVNVTSRTSNVEDISFNRISSFANFTTDDGDYVATSNFLQKFRSFSQFKQIRFQCHSTITNRIIHIKTKNSETGIIDYMIGAKDIRPASCGTFTIYDSDDSLLSRTCDTWYGGTWGFPEADASLRLVDHPFFVYVKFHFLLHVEWQRFECDNFRVMSAGDFWKVFVR
eukprot:gene5923-6609_t